MAHSQDHILCLHFDINKTIVMKDRTTVADMVNSVLSECTWGVMTTHGISKVSSDSHDVSHLHWDVSHPLPSVHPPSDGSMTFGDYLENHSELDSTVIRQLKRTYTEPLSTGERFRSYFHHLHSSLQITDASKLQQAREMGLNFLSSGYYHLIPSFFALIEYLVLNGIQFRLLFRTFGKDLDCVVQEFNLFCTGEHPLYRSSVRLDGTDARYPVDYRLKLPFFNGVMVRTGLTAQDVHLADLSPNQVVALPCNMCS
jgi:hypothetical protein